MNNKQKIFLTLALTLSLVFVVFVPRAVAVGGEILAGATSGVFFLTIGWILEIIMRLLGMITALGGKIFDWLIGWTKFTELPIIIAGWRIMRDFANIGIVFVLLVIAISTILGIDKYNMKQLFAKLVIIALLVNFSMLIANVVIDTSNVITDFFVQESGIGSGGNPISTKIMGSMGIGQIWHAVGTGNFDVGLGALGGTVLISMIMGIIVMLGTIIVLFLGAGMLLVRIIVLSFCIILAPAAFMLKIMPDTQKHYEKWWSTLINYSLFAPVFAFFLYLALRTADTFGQIESLKNANVNIPTMSSFFSTGNTLIQYILILGFTLASLMMAKQFGLHGGAKVYGWGTKALQKATGYSFAKKHGTKFAEEKARNFGIKTAQGLRQWGESIKGYPRLAKVPLGIPGLLARQAGVFIKPGEFLKQQRKDIAEEKKDLEHALNPDMATEAQTAHGLRLIALMEKLVENTSIENKNFDFDADAEKIQDIFQLMASKGGNFKDLLRHRPDWAIHARDAKITGYDGLTDKAAIEKAVKSIGSKHASKINFEALRNSAHGDTVTQKLVAHMRSAHIEEIDANGSNELVSDLIKAFKDPSTRSLLAAQNPRLEAFLDSELGQGKGWQLA